MVEAVKTVELDLESAAAQVRAYGAEMETRFLERKDEIRGLLLAALAGCHILLLGPPGTAKSETTETFAGGLGKSCFTMLMGKTTVPEEVFGPYSMTGLRADRYERKVDGFLPSVQIAFLDEVFKANSAILNALLTILNERKYSQNGVRVRAPLEFLVGASNELPQDDGLGALYDRFLLRYWTKYLQDDGNFRKLLMMQRTAGPELDPQVLDFLRGLVPMVDLEPIGDKVVALRNALSLEHGIVASDRRWRQCMSLIAASAVLDGRVVAQSKDLAVLVHALWNKPEEIDPIRATVSKIRSPELFKVNELLAVAMKEKEALPKPETVTLDQSTELGKAIVRISQIVEEAKRLNQEDPEVAEATAEIRAVGKYAQQLVTRAMGRTSI